MAKFTFHMGVTLRCYGNVEVEAHSIEAAFPMLTADFVGEHIDITETTTDSGQDLAVIDVSDSDTGEELASYDGHFLPSMYDLQPDSELLAVLKEAVDAWPQFDAKPTLRRPGCQADDDVEVDGGDMVEWFGEWRSRVAALVAKAVADTRTDDERMVDAFELAAAKADNLANDFKRQRRARLSCRQGQG